MGSSVYLIAEAGSCHDGDYLKAARLVLAAKEAGASAIKFQYWSDPDALADRRRVPQHYREVYRRYRVGLTWLQGLAQEAHALGLDFMCTAYLPQDVAAVAPHVKHFKVASFEAEAQDVLKEHVPFMEADQRDGSDRHLMISMGMAADLNLLEAIPFRLLHRVELLHCVSAYPVPVEELNLRALRGDNEAVTGFSDHSDPELLWTGALAVAAGAEIVEAHLKLDATDPENPDAPHAMTPQQFKDYVRHIRFAEAALGTGTRTRVQPSEREMAQYKVGR